MAEAVTIIGSKLSYGDVASCIYGCTAGEFTVEGPKSSWESITVKKGRASLTFSAMRFRKPADPFTQQVLVLANLAANRSGMPEEMRDPIETRIANAKMMIGVVGKPRLDSIVRGEDAIYSIAEEIDGILFTGDEFLDPMGNVLLKLPSQDV